MAHTLRPTHDTDNRPPYERAVTSDRCFTAVRHTHAAVAACPQLSGGVFGLADLIQDAALANIGGWLVSGSTQTIAQLVRREFAIDGDYAGRFADFVNGRFDGSHSQIADLAYEVLASNSPAVATIRDVFMKQYQVPDFSGTSATELHGIAQAFADKVWELADIT